ncbi:MAG: MATE family efflux transporter [Candidatus Ventricola sp.]
MQGKTLNLTEGRPITRILLFSVPLILGTLFQQLYSFADTLMVGRLVGTDALAAVGATYSLGFLTLGFVQGTCVGFSIPLSQSFGAMRPDEFKRYFAGGLQLCAALALVMTTLMTVFCAPLLRLMRTPGDIFAMTKTYATVIFLGIPASILYNFCAGALRAAGDSRHPFYFLLFSTALNIVLDYLFIVPLSLGVFGAALATVLSQLVSGLLNLYWILRKTTLLAHLGQYAALSPRHLRRLCVIGFPMGVEYSISAIGAVVMQGAINTLGTAAVAGQTAGEKIRQMFTLPMESVGMAMATYAGQNEGAKRYDRIRSGIRAGLTIQWTYCACAWVVIFFAKDMLSTLVLGAQAAQEIALSSRYLSVLSIFFCLHGGLMIMRNTLQGMGYSVQAVFSGFMELAGRSLGSVLCLAGLGYLGVCLSNPLAFGFAFAYCAARVHAVLKTRR